MKQIICYGDSNTFGYIPGSGKRYSKDIRWTGVLSNLLGDEYKVIEEGCNNRTGFVRNPSGKLFSGSEYINECFINTLYNEMCKHLEDLHDQVQYFPNDQCMMLQSHIWVKSIHTAV